MDFAEQRYSRLSVEIQLMLGHIDEVVLCRVPLPVDRLQRERMLVGQKFQTRVGETLSNAGIESNGLLVERRAGVVLGEHVLEHRVGMFDGGHRLIDELTDGGLPRLVLQTRPARPGRHPENIFGDVLVAVLGRVFTPFSSHGRLTPFERIGDVFQKEESKDDVLVLGSIH